MLIEFAGLPGSGKTTLLKRLSRELEKQDISVTDANTIADKRSDDKNVPRFVRERLIYRFGCDDFRAIGL